MDNHESFVREDVKTKKGVPAEPQIIDVALPFSGEKLLGDYSFLVKDRANGLNAALIKTKYPQSDVHAIVVDAAEAEEAIRNYFRSTVLTPSYLHQGNSAISQFDPNCFQRAIDIDTLHLEDDRDGLFYHVQRILKNGGIYAIHTDSAIGLGIFRELGEKYDIHEITESTEKRTRKAEFDEDVRKICEENEIRGPLEPKDFSYIERAVANSKKDSSKEGAKKYFTDVTPRKIMGEMKEAGFRDVYVYLLPRPGLTFTKRMDVYARK